MADRGKYVIIKEWHCMDFVPLVFPVYIGHRTFIERLGLTPDDIHSAGFVRFGVDPKTNGRIIECEGRSDTLNKESQPGDSKLVTRLFKDPFWDD